MQGSPRKGQGGKAQEGRQQLQELLSCQICYCRALQPTLCPHCSKLYCEGCLSASLRTKPECPNCRRSLRGTVVQCGRFVGEVAAVLQKLLEGSEQTERCTQHGIALNYFCSDCRRSACCECKMFGQHQQHHFTPISQLYEHKYQQIRDLLSQLRTRIVQQEHLLTETENLLIGAKSRTQAHLAEIDEHAEKYRLKMGGQCVEEGVDVQELRKEGADLAEIKQALVGQLEHALKANCYRLDQDLLDRLEALLANHSNRIQQVRSVPAAEEAMPPLRLNTCTITNYSRMSAERQVFYSEPVEYEGSKWRLVVYPGGSTSNSRSVSVFLELLSNPDVLNLYLYHIELLHPHSQPTLSLSKYHHARFSPNESLGYAKFITHQDLHQKQFVNESEDTLTFAFGVRFCTYFDLYIRRQTNTAYLESEIAEREGRINELERSVRSSGSIELQ